MHLMSSSPSFWRLLVDILPCWSPGQCWLVPCCDLKTEENSRLILELSLVEACKSFSIEQWLSFILYFFEFCFLKLSLRFFQLFLLFQFSQQLLERFNWSSINLYFYLKIHTNFLLPASLNANSSYHLNHKITLMNKRYILY